MGLEVFSNYFKVTRTATSGGQKWKIRGYRQEGCNCRAICLRLALLRFLFLLLLLLLHMLANGVPIPQ